MSPVILACVLIACLIPQPSIIGAVSEPGIGDNKPNGTHSHLPTTVPVTINSTSIVPAPSSTKNTSGPTSSPMVKPTSRAPSNSTTTINSSSSTPRTSSPSSPTSSSSKPITSTSATHAGGSSSVTPVPTISPTPPATTAPHTTHHPTDGTTTEPKTAKPKPTEPKTTEPPQPVPNNNRVIHGLIAGIVIFAFISVVLLVLLIFLGRVIYTKGDQYRRLSNNDDM